MLREICPVRQYPDDYFRRVFHDETLCLYVWYNQDESIHGFQLCYAADDRTEAVTWRQNHGFSHSEVDEGDSNPFFNRTPILVPSASTFDPEEVLEAFRSASFLIPFAERAFVEQKLAEFR
jgi:hypothetical protein